MLLRVVRWIMAVLQAALAVQYLFNSLVRIAVLHPLVLEDTGELLVTEGILKNLHRS